MGLLGIILQVLLVPQLVITYRGDNLSVGIKGSDKTMDHCARGGLELRCQFQFEGCRRRGWWLDECKEVRDERNSLRYNLIADSYKVDHDRLNDEDPPKITEYASFEKALAVTTRVNSIPLSFITHKDPRFLSSGRLYVDVRATCYCKEEYNQTLARVADIFTLGLVELRAYDSGWRRKEISR